MKPKTVKLFLIDGTPTGILSAEIMNWTGQILAGPRSRLPDALQRPEAKGTGVYFLIGDDTEDTGKPLLYIGEADSVAERFKTHNKSADKNFWTHSCIVTAKDGNLTKAHVRYLESRLIELAKLAGRVSLANGNAPPTKHLPESDVVDMEFFLEQLQIALPLVGFDVIRPKLMPSDLTGNGEAKSSALSLILTNKKHGIEAQAIEKDGEFVVLAGSLAVTKEDFSQNSSANQRNKLIRSGALVLDKSQNFYVFAENVAFKSPSVAASVIMNSNRNGREEWRVAETGQTLKEWQEAALTNMVAQ